MGPWLVPPAGTLPFELVLYVFFALLLLAGWAIFVPAALVWCGLILTQWSGRLGWGSYPILPSPYVLEFFLGAVGATILQRVRVRVSGRSLCAAVALCLMVGLYDSVATLNGWYHDIRNFAVPYLLLVMAGAGYELQGARRCPRLLMRLGDASYSIYLTHYYLLSELDTRMRHHTIFKAILGRDGSRLVVFVVVIAIGVACWTVIERPLVRLSRRLLDGGRRHADRSNRRWAAVLPFAVGCALVVAAVGYVVAPHIVTVADVQLFRVAPSGKREQLPAPASVQWRGGVLPPRGVLTFMRGEIRRYMRQVEHIPEGTRYEFVVHYGRGPAAPTRRHTFVFPRGRAG